MNILDSGKPFWNASELVNSLCRTKPPDEIVEVIVSDNSSVDGFSFWPSGYADGGRSCNYKTKKSDSHSHHDEDVERRPSRACVFARLLDGFVGRINT